MAETSEGQLSRAAALGRQHPDLGLAPVDPLRPLASRSSSMPRSPARSPRPTCPERAIPSPSPGHGEAVECATMALDLKALSQSRLPLPVRAWCLLPATFGAVFLAGKYWTLPPGPLCDEGMLLFLEGGCDWGRTNVFFWSRVGLLSAVTVALVAVLAARRAAPLAFVPHVAAVLLFAVADFDHGSCDTYYDHPNGCMAQSTVEILGWSVLGLVLASRFRGASRARQAAVVVAWWAAYLATFHGALAWASHWTWRHSLLVTGVLVGLAGLASYPPRRAIASWLAAVKSRPE